MLTRQELKQILYMIEAKRVDHEIDVEDVKEILEMYTEPTHEMKMAYQSKLFNPATGLWTTFTSGGDQA